MLCSTGAESGALQQRRLRNGTLLARSLEFDGSYVWRPVIAGPDNDGWAARDAVEAKLAREMEIDPDAYVLEVQDRHGRNPFDLV